MRFPRPRVLVTRAQHQGSELAGQLRALGLHPVLIPAIETVEPTSFVALDHALGNLNTFDWLLFTSANAVDAFAKRLRAQNPRVPHRCDSSATPDKGMLPPMPAHAAQITLPPTLKLAAIGPSTARSLEKLGLTPDLIPPQAVAESLTEALLPYARQPDGIPARFLLIRAEEAREHLPETLRAAAAEVVIAPAYRTVIPAGSVEALHDLFAAAMDRVHHASTAVSSMSGVAMSYAPQPPIDAIAFTSSSTARNLLTLCEAAGVTPPDTALRISIGPITSQTLCDLGLPPHAEAPEPTIACLAETVVKAVSASETTLHSK